MIIPYVLAQTMVNRLLEAGLDPYMKVLLPHIAVGGFIPLLKKEKATIFGFDKPISQQKKRYYNSMDAPVLEGYFLNWVWPRQDYDFVIMVTPLAEGKAALYVEHAWKFLRYDGRMVALCPAREVFDPKFEWIKRTDHESILIEYPMEGETWFLLTLDRRKPVVRQRTRIRTAP